MSIIQNNVSDDLAVADAFHSMHIQSIDVKFKGNRKRPASIKVRIGEEEQYVSPRYGTNETVHWVFNKCLSSPSQFAITVQEHHRVRRVDECTVRVAVTDDVIMKPIISIDEPNGKKLSVIIHCETAGPFIDLIRCLVQETQNKLDNMKVFMENLTKACEILNYIVAVSATSDIHPAAGAAVSAVTLLYEACKKRKECHEVASALMADIAALLPFVEVPKNRLKANVTAETARGLLELFERTSRTIIQYSDETALGILLRSRITEVTAHKEELRRLKETFDWCVKTETWKTVLKIESYAGDTTLTRLRPVLDAFYDLDRTCLDGSRMETLQMIEEWSLSSSKLFWLYGSPGSGKTTIAHTVAQIFDEQHRLAGCFFCDRNDTDRRSPKAIMPTVAYQLAKWHEDYRSIILDILQSRGELDIYTGIQRQFDLLVSQSISRSSVRLPPKHRPLVIVLDALDESCDSVNSRRHLAEYVYRLANAAPWLKVFVSSLRQPELEVHFLQDDAQHLDISNPFLDLQNDTAAFVQCCTEDRTTLQPTGQDNVYKLPHLLSRFSWVFRNFRVDTIDNADILSESIPGESKVDRFFHTAILGVLRREGYDNELMPLIRSILTVISSATLYPQTSDTLPYVLRSLHAELELDTLRTILGSLQPIVFRDQSGSFRTMFPSGEFLTFLSDKHRAGHLWMDVQSLNMTLSRNCLHTMHSQLKFNICGLESSHLANHSVTDISARVKKNVSETLTHSSVHWMEHISQSDNAQTFNASVVELLCSSKALFWIEILSLLGLLEKGKEILFQCTTHFKNVLEIIRAATELHGFISSFQDAIAVSTPHLYVSALAWFPQNSFTAQNLSSAFSVRMLAASHEPLVYKNRFGSIVPSRGADISFLKGEKSSVFSTGYTSDGSKIVSRSYDERLQVWNAQSGLPICKAFESRMSGINAIAYSPDGSKIVTACSDEKPRIWDVQTGALLVEPLSGHERQSWIWDVAYSPDGTRVVSASTDKTLRIWDAQDGVCISELQGHTDAVHAVVYAPNGKRIVSSSGDGTLRIWDAENGVPMGEPLKGHKGWIWAIAFSPDGNRIVSGSFANTLQIWDAHDGKSITARSEPRNGYGDIVGTMAYSADGSRIVSGCENGTLRFWDVQSGKPNGQSPRRHESRVKAVAFSPDGSRIASGSEDKTVRIWDAQSGELIGEPMTGHEEKIVAVEYSPDGKRIASGSWDGTIRIWDACDGTLVNLISVMNDSRWDDGTSTHLTIFDDRCIPLRRIEQTVNPIRMSADGWIRTLDGGLLLWVPPEHRTSLCTRGQVRILDDRGRRFMKLNWSKICHGKDWINVYLDSAGKP